jgi:hypothetical protein
MRIETFTPTLSDAELALVCSAFEGWDSPDAFSDANVDEVKALFVRVFGLDAAVRLAGHTINDALLLRERDQQQTYYAAVRVVSSSTSDKKKTEDDDETWTWKRVEALPDGDRVMVRSEILDQSIPFEVLLLMMGQ